MSSDIVPTLLDEIQKDFQKQFNSNSTISSIYGKLKSKNATYKEANEFAIQCGEMLAKSFSKYISADTLPEGRMWYNIATRILNPTLRNNYSLITDVTDQTQTILNEKAGIGLKPLTPAFNTDRVNGLINKVSNAEDYNDVSWLLQEPVVNYSQSVVDEAIKGNADYQYKSGLQPKIVRTLDSFEYKSIRVGNKKVSYQVPCKWCQGLAGTYDYPYVPSDVYRRHENCRCTVEYIGAGKKQNVWTKNYEAVEEQKQNRIDEQNRLAENKVTAKQRIEKVNNLQWENAKTLNEAFEYTKDKLGLYITDTKGLTLDTMNMINREIQKYYDMFGSLYEKDVLNGLRIVPGKKRYVAAYQKAMGEVILVKSNLTKKGYAQMLEDAIIEKDVGFWSTAAREHSIRHELGHAIEKLVKNNDEVFGQIEALRQTIMDECGLTEQIIAKQTYTKEQMKKAAEYLSYYGMYSEGEFIAEAMAEVMNGNPRKVASTVLDIILKGLR